MIGVCKYLAQCLAHNRVSIAPHSVLCFATLYLQRNTSGQRKMAFNNLGKGLIDLVASPPANEAGYLS